LSGGAASEEVLSGGAASEGVLSGGEAPLIFLIAGEPSGDVLGAALMAALEERTQGHIRFAGIGGERMAARGLRSLVPIHELAIMGIAEVLPRARNIFRRVKETADAIIAAEPAAVVTIDSRGFTWRVAKTLRKRGSTLPLIHYVAPMVWAWRAKNAFKIARWYDHLMVLLPFEPPYFEAAGMACSYVGHPVVEGGADRGDGAAFRARHGIAAERKLLCVLPGSRRGEVARLLPVLSETVGLLKSRFGELGLGDLAIVIPTVENVAEQVTAGTRDWPVPPLVIAGQDEKFDAFAASDAALAASGTVGLELAMAGLPSVITYRLTPLTSLLARYLVKVPFVNLINLVLGRAAVPEMLLEKCRADLLAAEVERLLTQEQAARDQRADYREALLKLGLGGESPALRAADTVLSVLAARR